MKGFLNGLVRESSGLVQPWSPVRCVEKGNSGPQEAAWGAVSHSPCLSLPQVTRRPPLPHLLSLLGACGRLPRRQKALLPTLLTRVPKTPFGSWPTDVT